MTYFRVDKRLFAVGECIETANQYYSKFVGIAKDVEDALENFRPKSKPQRTTCLFLFEDEICARMHWSMMKDGKLYEASIDECCIFHRGDMALMDRMKDTAESGGDLSLLAKQYWNGEFGEKPEIELLVPSAIVVKIIETSDVARRAHLEKRWISH